MNPQAGVKKARCSPGKGSPFLGGQQGSDNRIRVTLVANAGVLIQHRDTGILVDGIHHEKGHPFSPVALGDLKKMQQGVDIFKNLNYLLFTHEHPDHFSPSHVRELLRHRSVDRIFLPDEADASSELSSLFSFLQKRSIPFSTFGLEPGTRKQIHINKDFTVTAIGSRHMGPQFQAVRNDCFLLTLAGTNLLFTGDADHVADYFAGALEGVDLHAAFVNPIFYHNPNGQDIIDTIFRPRHIVIYHMPFAEDDTMNFSYSVQSDIKRYGRSDVPTHLLANPGQSLTFYPEVG